jgi:hypothetical protein
MYASVMREVDQLAGLYVDMLHVLYACMHDTRSWTRPGDNG